MSPTHVLSGKSELLISLALVKIHLIGTFRI